MRRADRLFEIVQLLRGSRLRTARELAERLEVSVRTVYRDIQDLIATGVPIDGEAGVGYVLRSGHFLPPLTLTPIEARAMALGARLVASWADTELADAATEVLAKLDGTISQDAEHAMRTLALFSHGMRVDPATRARLQTARRALESSQKLHMAYLDADGRTSERTVRPLSLDFWGHVWTLTGWCELRADFRAFRLDRMTALSETEERFRPEPGKTLPDYLTIYLAKMPPVSEPTAS